MAKLEELFSEQDRKNIARAIHDVETHTQGEVRVRIIESCEEDETPQERAKEEFHDLGLHRTREGTGVLIFLAVGQQRMEILGDWGIHARVKQHTWGIIVDHACHYFREGKYVDGILKTIDTVGKILALHFPKKAGDVNELLDDPVIGDRKGGRS
ncbi:MAG: TPM domain-containing protein [Parcubacteria group bacterium]|nr:TPM domain-containing protein [Parcubacteria group bacterium]